MLDWLWHVSPLLIMVNLSFLNRWCFYMLKHFKIICSLLKCTVSIRRNRYLFILKLCQNITIAPGGVYFFEDLYTAYYVEGGDWFPQVFRSSVLFIVFKGWEVMGIITPFPSVEGVGWDAEMATGKPCVFPVFLIMVKPSELLLYIFWYVGLTLTWITVIDHGKSVFP